MNAKEKEKESANTIVLYLLGRKARLRNLTEGEIKITEIVKTNLADKTYSDNLI